MVSSQGRRGHPGRSLALLLAATLAVVVSGCASTAVLPGHGAVAAAHLVGQDGPPADPGKVAVVRHWAAALRAGNLKGAAGYFHLPSLFDNGVSERLRIQTRAQAELVNSTLSCGARVISAFRVGRFIDVLFRLTSRSGRGGGRQACGTGVGQTARTDFLIHDGKIYQWLRAPSLPGDPGVPGGPSAPQGNPGGTSGGGLPV